MMNNLLIETRLFEGKVNEDEGGRTIVKGILQRAGTENQNGRIYPRQILEREAKKYEVLIKERDEDGTKKMLKAFIGGLVNAQRSLKLESTDSSLPPALQKAIEKKKKK